MKTEFNKSVLIFLLTSVGLIVFPHVAHLPISIFSFFLLMLGWRFAGIWRPNWLPNNPVILLLMVAGLALLYSQHQGLFGRDAGTRLFVIALGLKLMEIKSERDLYLITYLAFIVAASQFLYEQSLPMAAYILVICCALLATLICINTGKPQTIPALKTAAILIAQALPIAIALFVLFPRVQAPRWMLLNDEHQARAGLSDSMEPGSISDLGLSFELAFRVKFTGAIPPPEQRYWRGPVLSHTDGKRWTQVKNMNYAKFMDTLVVSGRPYHYTLLMEPQQKNWVFALDMPAEFSAYLSQNANYQLITSENPDKRAEYNITSYLQYNTGYLTRTEYKENTQLPSEPSTRIRRLVTQLHGFDNPPENFIKQLLNHFRKEDFHYTLTPPLMEKTPVETFLFERRYGFCSHYAAAFVYLMRVAEIPARIVTGYQGGELNKVGNFLEIRQANAHAWAEVWLENKGWIRVDPTAAIAPERIERDIDIAQLEAGGMISYLPSGVNTQADFNWLKQAKQLWSDVDYNWQRWVINYNSVNQSKFLSSLGIADIKAMLYWLIGVITVITTLLSWFLLYQKRKTTDPVLITYRQFCKKIAGRGLLRRPGEGERDFARRIKEKLPEHATEIDKITDIFIKLRYGRASTPAELKEFDKQVAKFRL